MLKILAAFESTVPMLLSPMSSGFVPSNALSLESLAGKNPYIK
jgi:hypothetical protein